VLERDFRDSVDVRVFWFWGAWAGDNPIGHRSNRCRKQRLSSPQTAAAPKMGLIFHALDVKQILWIISSFYANQNPE
jgi:hypothetical protein